MPVGRLAVEEKREVRIWEEMYVVHEINGLRYGSES